MASWLRNPSLQAARKAATFSSITVRVYSAAVTIAINEIYENKVSFKNPDQDHITVDDRIMNMILEEDRHLAANDHDVSAAQ